jgi:hypothetical protein
MEKKKTFPCQDSRIRTPLVHEVARPCTNLEMHSKFLEENFKEIRHLEHIMLMGELYQNGFYTNGLKMCELKFFHSG